jgi:hypothetical protein
VMIAYQLTNLLINQLPIDRLPIDQFAIASYNRSTRRDYGRHR